MSIDPSLVRSAVNKALKGKWQDAVEINQSILEKNPKNVATLNRLAKAYFELGNLKNAKATYKKVLEVERYNPIALKNLKKIESLKSTPSPSLNNQPRESLFLEEPGKTKSVKLIRLGDKEVLTQISPGDVLKIEPKKRLISLSNSENDYVGSLPEVVSFRLIKLIKNGNRYQALAKSASENQVVVFLKETYQSPKSPTASFT